MLIRRLRLRDFRNYAALDISFQEGITVLTGPNGAGKSNLLEAIHYLSYLTSFRQSRDREVVRFGAPFALIEASLEDDQQRPFDARLILKGGKRHVRLNGSDITRFRDFIGRLHSQFFFPGDLALITGDPLLRREALDVELLRIKPPLVELFSRYATTLRERNRVLKLLYPQPGVRSQNAQLEKALLAYSEQLIAIGTQVIRERRGLIKVLDALFQQTYSSLAPPDGETVLLRYYSPVDYEQDDAISASFAEKLAAASESEAQLRFTTVGPHRDDIGFQLDGARDLKRFGSQGQQRCAALAFRLAMCALSQRRLSDDPMLLLDDALSEMDDQRKSRLLDLCRRHRQVFITSASEREVELIAPLATQVCDVDSGSVQVRAAS